MTVAATHTREQIRDITSTAAGPALRTYAAGFAPRTWKETTACNWKPPTARASCSARTTSYRTDSAAHDPALSPRLHNPDLAPTKAEGRTWGRYSIFALWTNDVHNIANYSFAIGLFALGLSGWQMLASLAIGAVLVYCFMNLTGYMGQKTGVPFP